MTTASSPTIRPWTDIEPGDATTLDLTKDLTITAPLNENGERCPWPWEPQQLVGAPMGQYRCGYCGAMCMAGLPHFDYAPEERTLTRGNTTEIAEWCGGRRAGGARELVAIDQFGDTEYARPGDTVHRGGAAMTTPEPFVQTTRIVVSCLPEGHDDRHTYTVQVEYRGSGRYAVTRNLRLADADGNWEYEPDWPETGIDEQQAWLKKRLFDHDTALALAKRLALTLAYRGRTVTAAAAAPPAV